MKGYFITGTDTNVGKTVATAVLATLFQEKNKKVSVMKPVGTGGKDVDGRLISEDAIFLKDILKLPAPLELINPVCLKHPLAPKVAADQTGQEVDLAAVTVAFEYLKDKGKPDIMLIEGVGGILVPIRHDYLVVDMIKQLGFPVIIVARPGLGTINHTLLTTSFLKQEKIPIAGIIFNNVRKSEKSLAEKTNPQEIKRLSGLPILGEIPYLEKMERTAIAGLGKQLNLSTLL
jgi:dethiobiotin synthetase